MRERRSRSGADEAARVHIVLQGEEDLEEYQRKVAAGLSPRNVIYELVEMVGGFVHYSADRTGVAGLMDRACARILARPGEWATAQRLSKQVGARDTILCSDDVGIVLVMLCALRRKRPRLVVQVMTPSRPRMRLTIGRRFVRRRVDLFLVNSAAKADYLESLGVAAGSALVPPDVVDEQFYAPVEDDADLSTSWIASSGREQRDYATLADAFETSSHRVRVCATSGNPSSKQKIRLPEVVPDNMEMRHFPWPEYRELLQRASVIVIPLLPHDYSAGLTVLYEAFACGRPTVITRTPGRMSELEAMGLTLGVPAGDPEALRATVDELLADPARLRGLGQRGYEFHRSTSTHAIFLEWMANVLLDGGRPPERASQLEATD